MWIGLRAWFMLEGRDLFRALGTSTFRLDAPRLCFRVSPTDELHGFHGGQRLDLAEHTVQFLGLVAPVCSAPGEAACGCSAGFAVDACPELLALGELLPRDLPSDCPCVLCFAFWGYPQVSDGWIVFRQPG